MSGEIDITRGYTFTSDNEPVTVAKLNLLGGVTAQVRAGSIGAREIDAAEVAGALENVAATRNHLRDPLFLGPWAATSKVVTGGAARFATRDWYVSPETAAATSTVSRDAATPTGQHGNRWALKVTGDVSNTGATAIGQLIPAAVAGALDDSVAISFWFKNGTGDDITPSIRLLAATSADDWSSLAEIHTETTSEVVNGQWARITAVIDTSGMTNWRNGGAFEVVVPVGSLDAGGKSVSFCMAQMEAGEVVTSSFIVPEARENDRAPVATTSDPGVNDDWLDGYFPGDLWINTTSKKVWLCQASEPAGAAVWQSVIEAVPSLHYIHLQDRKAQNTSGGTATSGSWYTRDLNTECLDTGNHCSLATNQMTLEAGTYDIVATVPGYRVNSFQARLYNVTDAIVQKDTAANDMYSSTEYTGDTTANITHAVIAGRFTIAVQNVLRIEMRVTDSQTTTGGGIAANLGPEVYTQVRLVKLS